MSRANRNLMNVGGKCVAFLLACAIAPATAGAWGTEEHIAFGHQIAEPFDTLIGERVPVISTTNGPKNFGDWVSAPDFARSLGLFVNLEASTGSKACATLWTVQGVLGMEVRNDQAFANVTDESMIPDGILDKSAFLDCVDSWAINNNHFGDFARVQYNYYHNRAIEAAQRYRASGNEECRSIAYSLEGWGQHYLTDSVASGHAWNPPGNYSEESNVGFLGFSGKSVNILTGIGIRMKIHDFFHVNGAKMANPHYDEPTYWGDNSQDRTDEGLSIPNLPESNQYAKTMDLARSGLGQVAAAVECGGAMSPLDLPISESLAGTDAFNDVRYVVDHFVTPIRGDGGSESVNLGPRRFFVSNNDMCAAIKERAEFSLPGFVLRAATDWSLLDDFITECKDDGTIDGDGGGVFADGPSVAACFFAEAYSPNACHEKDGGLALHIATRDPKSDVDLDALGCPEVETPPTRDKAFDVCGNAMCETPTRVDGTCAGRMQPSNGCCYLSPPVNSEAAAIGYFPNGSWQIIRDSSTTFTEMPIPGREPGDMSEFLWIKDSGAQGDYPQDWVEQAVDADTRNFNGLVSHTLCSGGVDAIREEIDEDGFRILVCADDKSELEPQLGSTLQGCESWGEPVGGQFPGESAQVTVYETRVTFPSSKELQNKVLMLEIDGIDEGLKVQVDGHIVGYVARSEMLLTGDNIGRQGGQINGIAKIPLLTTSAKSLTGDDAHVIRLSHMNSCDSEVALTVGLRLVDKNDANCARCDGFGGTPEDEATSGCGCGVSGKGSLPGLAFFLLLGFVALSRRRKTLSN